MRLDFPPLFSLWKIKNIFFMENKEYISRPGLSLYERDRQTIKHCALWHYTDFLISKNVGRAALFPSSKLHIRAPEPGLESVRGRRPGTPVTENSYLVLSLFLLLLLLGAVAAVLQMGSTTVTVADLERRAGPDRAVAGGVYWGVRGGCTAGVRERPRRGMHWCHCTDLSFRLFAVCVCVCVCV